MTFWVREPELPGNSVISKYPQTNFLTPEAFVSNIFNMEKKGNILKLNYLGKERGYDKIVKQLQEKMFHFISYRISTESSLGWGKEGSQGSSKQSGSIPTEKCEISTLEDIPLYYS